MRGCAGAGPAHPAEARVSRGVDPDPRLGPSIVKWLLGVPDDLRQQVGESQQVLLFTSSYLSRQPALSHGLMIRV